MSSISGKLMALR